MFLDLTLEPLVAAFFATHASTGGRYEPIPNEPGVVFRWPAWRVGEVELQLLRRIPPADEYDRLPALDLTHIHSSFARPWNQRAVMAITALRPFRSDVRDDPVGHPILETPIDYLIGVDPTAFPTCERFQLPEDAGSDLRSIAREGLDALFPDRIDLGYSFVSVAALLSLVAIDPDFYGSGSESERSSFKTQVRAGCALIQRECFRLIPGISLPRLDMTLQDAILELQLAVMRGRDAATLPLGNRERRREILPDLELWSERVAEISEQADNLPIYAVENPEDYPDLVRSLPSDLSYRESVERQLEAVRQWNKLLQELES
jgi:hypothetical protein